MSSYSDRNRTSSRARSGERSEYGSRSSSRSDNRRSFGADDRNGNRSQSQHRDASRRRSSDERENQRSRQSSRGIGRGQATSRQRRSEEQARLRYQDERMQASRCSPRQSGRRREPAWGEEPSRQRRQYSGEARRDFNRTRNAGARRRNPSKQEPLPLSLYHRLEDALPESIPPIFAISVVLLVVFLVFAMFVIPSCNGIAAQKAAEDAKAKAATAATQSTSTETASSIEIDTSNASQAELVKVLGTDDAKKLLAKAKTNDEALWIAAHPDYYTFNGTETQYKLLKLATEEDAAIPFVRSCPSSYPTTTPSADSPLALASSSPSTSIKDTNIPHLYQWDMRWANTSFADNAMGVTGSGPTCMAMVYQGLTGDTSKTPYDIGQSAEKADAVDKKLGMKKEYLYDGAEGLKLNCSELYPSYTTIRDALLTGQAVILVVDKGKFTSTESCVVLTGISDNGKAIMNDPYSMAHSSQTWDLDELANMATAMYVYWV